MKIINISFGQTFLKSSFHRLSKDNQEKLEYSYGLGQLNPNDIFLGSDRNGNLTLDVTRCTPFDYLAINMLIEPTPQNVAEYKLHRAFNKLGKFLYGPKYSIEKYVIKDLNKKTKEVLSYEIQDKIDEYNHIHRKSFGS